MSKLNIPSKLAKEPLIDVIFELRFTSHISGLSVLLPGLLFSKLIGMGSIEALPISQLPQQIREMDPTLQFSPLSRIVWGKFLILIGDRSVGIGCLMPYPGWREFKAAIETVIGVVHDAKLITTIDRYSVKYVDFFETDNDCGRALSKFNIDLRIGDHAVRAENTVIRVEIPRAPFIHAVQMMTTANIQNLSNGMKVGAILDVDTLTTTSNIGVVSFVSELPTYLDAIHLANKQMFFECLSVSGLNSLEPQYDE